MALTPRDRSLDSTLDVLSGDWYNRAGCRNLLLLAFFILATVRALAQSERLSEANQIGWYVYEGDHSVGKKWALHTEYQWRRLDFIRSWQQSLARLGVVYQAMNRVQVSAGYTHLTTFPYGEYPIADQGKANPEHRIYQDASLSDTLGIVGLEHRIRLEQRWLGERAVENGPVSEWAFQNRIRYQLSAAIPLQGATLDDGEFFLSFFDEVFIGFGANVGNNVFNQNRLFGGIGYRFQKHLQVELGYLYQIVQHAESDPLTEKPVFEYNQGFRLGLSYDLDFAQ
jgi:hypothetical protein